MIASEESDLYSTLPKIYTFIPYAIDFRLGVKINDFIDRLDDDSWILIVDYDTLFLTADW